MSYNADRLRYAINHIFLPYKLPQESDSAGEKDHIISKIVFDAIKAFRGQLQTDETLKWAAVIQMVRTFRDTQKLDTINASDVKGAFNDFHTGRIFALYVRAQNAGVILRRPSSEHFTFEAFEVSPPSADVINTTGRLICSYPGPAVQFGSAVFESSDFKNELANFLVQMNNESFVEDSEEDRSRRTSSGVEIGDTPDPKYITSLLTGILRGLEEGEPADVERITKHVRDEAICRGKEAPWRRSGAWHVLKIAIQTTLMQHDPSHVWYKSFMAYLHAFVLNLALDLKHDQSLGSDILQNMRVKAGRRLAKLLQSHTVNDFVRDYVLGACDRAQRELQRRWEGIQALDITPPSVVEEPWAPMALQVELDTIMRLNNSFMYITTALSPDAPQPTDLPAFTPSEQPRLRDVGHFGQATIAKLQEGYLKEPLVALADFEWLVARGSLDSWLSDVQEGDVSDGVRQDAPKHLWDLTRTYYSYASKYYAGNPEEQSIMVLTMLELWVAMDKLACTAYPLMKSYSPEVPLGKFYSRLLLRKAFDLERLRKVDVYLRKRHKDGTDGSVFNDKMSSRSFPIRYYNMSQEMKQLRTTIENDAQAQRDRTIQEYNQKKAEYKRLVERTNAVDHRHIEDEAEWGWTGKGNKKKRQRVILRYPECPKCQLEVRRDGIKVTRHEWPLPNEEPEIKRVIFELEVPTEFALWRAMTALLLWDMGTPAKKKTEFEGAKPSILLGSGKSPVSDYCTPADDDTEIITLASSSGSRLLSEGSTKTLPAALEEICVPSGMSWRGYDPRSRIWVQSNSGSMFREVDTKAYGTLAFDPNSPSMYLKAGLSYSMRGTTHTSNRVLAYQSDCPPEMSLHEYIAYGTMRAGGRIQWMNLLRELRATGSGLSWGNVEVGVLVNMVIAQVGPFQETNKKPTGDLEWHLDLKEYTFGLAILQEVNSLLDRIEGNWKEVTTVRTLVSIVSRLLASSPDAEVTTGCIEFLLKARQVTWSWLKQLEEKLQEAGEEFVRSFQDKVCEMAAVCRSTFDVDDVDENGNGRGYLPQLFVTAEDVSIYVCCGIRVHDNTPTDLEATKSRVSPSFKRLIRRDQRLAHAVELHFRSLISAAGNQNMGRQGLDQALSYIWAAYRSGRQQWNVMSGSNKRWVRCLAATEGAASQTLVNLDLVRCRLLVNGKPLGRLPPQITKHVLYMRIFGSQKVLDVIPSQFRGMEFETRTLICGYQVYFGMRDEKELVIRVSKDGQILELIPHEEFRGDLPIHLVEDHTHWLDLANGEVEIRPLSDVWESKDNNWVIHSQQAPRVCVNSTRTMIDVNSRTFQMIAATLEPFEQAEYLTVTCARNKDPTTISVDLPRYRLSFFRNENEALESRNFPGMVIDHDDQSIGALFGLRTRLVLRPDDPNLAGGRRRILIPYGKIDLPQYQSDHVEIYIDTKDARFIKFADYVVDTDQGCLTGNTSLKSRLYLVYLLALTSHCLPDPLSKQTGTEEALSELSSAACMSFRELGEEEIVLLLQIGKLSPNRFGAPQFSPKVQSITWNTLPSLSQHDGFALRARQILDCAELQKVFAEQKSDEKEENDAKKDALPKRNQTLDTRAATRAAVYYPAGIADRMLDQANDQKYTSRDESLLNETLVWSVATSVLGGGTSLALPRQTSLPLLFKRWEKVRAPSGNFKLSFSRSWMFAKMQEAWLSVYTLCTARGTSQEKRQYQLLFSLAAMVFANPDYSCFVPSIVLSSRDMNQLPALQPPQASGHTFNLQQGTEPNRAALRKCIDDAAVPLHASPSWSLPINEDESDDEHVRRRRSHHQTQTQRYGLRLLDYFISRWPGWTNGQSDIPFPSSVQRSYFLVDSLLAKVTNYFEICNENRLLLEHARRVNDVFNLHFDNAMAEDVEDYDFERAEGSGSLKHAPITLGDLLQRDCPPFPHRGSELWGDAEAFRRTDVPSESDKLTALLRIMDRSSLPLRKQYAQDLRESHRQLGTAPSLPSAPSIPFSIDDLAAQVELCEARYQSFLQNILAALAPTASWERAVASTGTWPRLTLRTLLRQLAYPYNKSLSQSWKEALILLAREILEYQRASRLLSYAQQSKKEDFFRELDTRSFDMEHALQYPDWAMIQIEGNFLARPLQLNVAREMIAPSSGTNTVLQLNMGEGKSSVIVPLVAAALANGERIVRVIVLKPLAGQMFQLLVERLSGLANRRIFYMPFTRKIHLGQEQVAQIQKLYSTCMEEGGIWVVQPEHILSFKLMGIDRSIVSQSAQERSIAESLCHSQRWLDQHSRDILDESDEILHIRYQLVYTVGQQQPLELHPDRWTIVEELFTLVSQHIEAIKGRNRIGVDLQPSDNGSFAPVRIIDLKAGRELVESVVADIFNDSLSTFSVRLLSEDVKNQARLFITAPKIPDELVLHLKVHFAGSDYKRLLLLRGLIAHGILLYALKEKQYRVDYGLDPSRSLLAVPYRAKDVPSIRAEFGHPDVCLALTCLSYYYEGLTSSQLKVCFDILFKLDNPTLEYEAWVNGDDDVPLHLRTLNGVNTEDNDQHHNLIVPLFSKRKTVVDFYLSHVVFPKAAKEFPYKLSTSGWDLAETKIGHVTTGFSGTNDNRFLLPTSISQEDPLGQSGTNAKVLTYLLQRENNHYRRAALPNGGRLPVRQFLEYLTQETSDNPVQVLLDVGAQMLDLRNDELARHWLTLRADMAAAIYFNGKDEMTVITQDGVEEPLMTSPFKGQLDRCLVYLDDAHTRGTDLKLPTNSRAAVTLGPKVTKDRLIQGCMRMRKLGFGQSLIFFAPDEIDRSIRKSRPAQSHHGGGTRAVPLSRPVHTEDILRWAIYETCRDIIHHLPHWAEQGWDYLRRRRAWEQFMQEAETARTDGDQVMNPDIDILRNKWVRDEARTLERMYGVITGPAATGVGGGDLGMREAIFAIPDLRKRLETLGVKEITDNDVDEEQEREVNHEVEQETEIERPPKVVEAKTSVSEGLAEFVKTGHLPWNGQGEQFRTAFLRMYGSLDGTIKKAPQNGQDVWHEGLWVTADFAKTISEKDVVERGNAEYLRPVNWILTSHLREDILIAISPHEANSLLPNIRASDHVSLHVYAPRVTKDMKPSDDLLFYSTGRSAQSPPPDMIFQLDLFAGQLYFTDFDAYVQICTFLGLHHGNFMDTSEDAEPHPVQSDGFVRPGTLRTQLGLEGCRFVESPIPFLQELIGLRRKGTGYLPTHLGRILHGKSLSENDFAS